MTLIPRGTLFRDPGVTFGVKSATGGQRSVTEQFDISRPAVTRFRNRGLFLSLHPVRNGYKYIERKCAFDVARTAELDTQARGTRRRKPGVGATSKGLASTTRTTFVPLYLFQRPFSIRQREWALGTREQNTEKENKARAQR